MGGGGRLEEENGGEFLMERSKRAYTGITFILKGTGVRKREVGGQRKKRGAVYSKPRR